MQNQAWVLLKYYLLVKQLQHNQITALSLVLVWLWPSCCCLQWERVCLSLPASISDRGTPGNILQRGTVSAFPSVYRASYSKGTAYYTPVCGGGGGSLVWNTWYSQQQKAWVAFSSLIGMVAKHNSLMWATILGRILPVNRPVTGL